MEQQNLYLPLRDVWTAREVGNEAAERATAKAEEDAPGFTLRARAHVIAYLSKYGPSWGEDIVDAGIAAGIKGKDGRAWGSVFSHMSRKQIVCLRSDGPRRHGRGTSGARLWGLVR